MNDSKAEGFFDEAKGKLKQAFGDATNNQSVANEGAADEVKGHAEQTWGSVKDAASSIGHHDTNTATTANADTAQTGHNMREDITTGAENLKNKIEHGLDNLTHKNDS